MFNVLDYIVYVFNILTGNTFELMTLEELSLFASTLDYWTKIFDVSFIMSFVIWISIFYFVWKITYQIFFRFFMMLVHFPKKWRNK